MSGTQRRTAAQHLASVWNDGKRRVVVAQPTHIRHENQSIVKLPTEVIDDAHTIALLEAHDIELIDLEVNGRPKKGQWLAADIDQVKNVDELAKAFGIMPNLLHAAIETGGPHIDAATNALADRVEESFEQYLAAHPVKTKPEPLTLKALSLEDAIALLGTVDDPHAKAFVDEAGTMLELLRTTKPVGEKTDEKTPGEADGKPKDWKPGSGE